MVQELLQSLHIAIGVLTGAATALLGLMFWNASVTNRDKFTMEFLRLLSVISVAKAVEISSAMYRTSRISFEAIPVDAAVVGLSGRIVEMSLYLITIWFLLRPETKRALNGSTKS